MPTENSSSFFSELKRRNVIRVALAYVLVAWVLLQIADVLFPALSLPDWTIRLVAGLLIIGFPLALVFAWVFELTPEGLKRESDIDRDSSTSEQTGQRLNYVTIGIAAVAITMFVADRFVLNEPGTANTGQTDAVVITDERSIAVLPFVNMSSDGEQEYFSDGLTEELLNVLARVKELRVIGRTSSFQFKGQNRDLREIGRVLDVSHILEGSVRKSGDRVRITAQLIGSHNGAHLWSDTYDRTLDDIFAVQDEIAASVVTALKMQLLGDNASHGTAGNADAYDLYLRGLQLRQSASHEDNLRAINHFKEALVLDPTLGRAWEQLGSTYANQVIRGVIPRDEGVQLFRHAANRAMELDPGAPGPHAMQGFLKSNFDWDWSGAEAAYARALEIDPSHERALSGASLLAASLGKHAEAVDFSVRNLQINPLSTSAMHNHGFVFYLGGDYEAAEAAFRRALNSIGGVYPGGLAILALTLIAQEKYDEALRESSRDPNEPFRLAAQSVAYYGLDDSEQSDAALQQLMEKYSTRLAVPIAGSHSFRGDYDEAFRWFNQAYEQRDPQLIYTKVHPMNRRIQEDPRFRELLDRLNLP